MGIFARLRRWIGGLVNIIQRSKLVTAVFRTSRGGRVTRPLRNVAVPTFAIGAPVPLAQAEGNSGSTPFAFTVIRAVRLDLPATVDWTAAGSGSDPASPGDLNGPTSGTLSFAPGETVKTIIVNVKGDVAAEASETFAVTLSNPSVGTIAVASSSATIIDDDTVGGPPTNFILAEDGGAILAEDGSNIITE